MQENDKFWLAGILEGEGYFGIAKGISTSGKFNLKPSVRVGMTDWDIILKVKDVIGYEDIKIRERELPSGKVHYIYDVGGKRSIDLMRLLQPLMGIRRYEAIKEILELWDSIYNPQAEHSALRG